MRELEPKLKLLVPTDFSLFAANALAYAIELAKSLDAKLEIIHVYNIPVVPGIEPFLPHPGEVQETIKNAEELLGKLPDEIPGLADLDYSVKTVPGYGVSEVPEIILQQQASMILMGTQGASGLKGVFFGSVTSKVSEQSIVPVLAIPEPCRFGGLKHIAFAYDGGVIPEKMGIVKQLADHFNAEVHAFNVTGAKKKEVELVHLNELFPETMLSYSVINETDVVNGINHFLEIHHSDLLVMIPRGHNLLAAFFQTNITQQAAFHLKTPILFIPET